MGLQTLQDRAVEIAALYDEKNRSEGRPAWDMSAYMAGFVGDAGDLSKLIMAKSNLREVENTDERIAHELSDCLWSVLVLARKLNVNLEAEFLKTMQSLERRITHG